MTDLDTITSCIRKKVELRSAKELKVLTDFLATILVFKKLDALALNKLTRYLNLAEF